MSIWTITNPGGSGTSELSALGLSDPSVDFRVMAVSTAGMSAARNYDSSAAWWDFDEQVTIYRDRSPFFTGRVQESPDSASGSAEVRTLTLADAWQDLQEVIYREPWGIGSGSFLYPRCVLGRNSAGANITTGEQIEAVIDYAITQGVAMQKGSISTGYQLWPSEARNQSCESIIVGELRFHPDWVAWLDHTTSPPTFHARSKDALDSVIVNIADTGVESFSYAEVKRTVPLGVSIVYESAESVDGEVYRRGYLDEAGETSGRRVIMAMIDLEGLNVQFQKSRVETRTLPTNAATMTAWMKIKYPELAAIPDGAFEWSNVEFMLAPEGAQPAPVTPQAVRLAKSAATELPRELVRGSIEDWMRVKVGRVLITYDLKIVVGATPPTEDQKKILAGFEGKKKTISVTATSATTKLYKGISSWTAGEGRPEGLAAAIFAAATEQQFEGQVTQAATEVPSGRFHGKKLTLMDGETTILSGAVIHSAGMEIEGGRMSLEFGPMPYLSAGDFLDLQRIMNQREVRWFSTQERTSNTLGAPTSGSSKGDNVGPYDQPDTITPPGGGGETLLRQWKATQATATTIDCTGGTMTGQAGFSPITVAAVTAMSATASGFVILTVTRDTATRAITGTPAISYLAGAIPESDYSTQKIPLAKVTVEEEAITEILPLQFEELHIFEDLAVMNGEFMLADILMAGRNPYELPPP